MNASGDSQAFSVQAVIQNLNGTTIAAALFVIYVVSRLIVLVNARKIGPHIPRLSCMLAPMDVPGVFIPTCWWNPGFSFTWDWRKTIYKDHDTILVNPWLNGVPMLYSSNLEVLRQTVAGGIKSAWSKPEPAYRGLSRWGMNVVVAEGETWRKHRRLMGPAFTNELYEMVWTEERKLYKDMIKFEGWEGKQVVDVPVFQDVSLKLALIVLARCGFGFDFSWQEPPQNPDGSMPIHKALQIISDEIMITAFTPMWFSKLPFGKFKMVGEAKTQLLKFMRDQAVRRQQELRSGSLHGESRKDAFTALIHASMEEEGKLSLTDEELVGNIFILLFAGHETTANTITATLGLLALHPEIQEEIYQHIISIVGHDKELEPRHYNDLYKVLAAFYEALRLHPAGTFLIRAPKEDTILQVPNPDGEGSTGVMVPKGTYCVFDMVGLQINPRYFDNPHEFRPLRWYGSQVDVESNFTAFSIGPRTCIGRKFANTEAVCLLASLLREWRVEVLLGKGETVDQWKARVMEAKIAMTLALNPMPLRFVRRSVG